MQGNPKLPRRVRVERGIYRNPSTGGFEIQYTDSTGRVRWQRVPGGLRDARFARAEVQARLGRGELVLRARRTFAEVGEEWLAAQTHLRPRTHELYGTVLRRAQRALRRETVTELFDRECTRRASIEPELAAHGTVLSHDYLDCPWWPDFILPARKNLAGDLLGKVGSFAGRRAASAGSDAPRFVFDEERYPFFEGQPGHAETMRSMRLHPVFDRAPPPLARFFGHLHGYLVEKRRR